MGYLQQLMQMPYAHWWVPGLIFVLVVSGCFWLLRTPSIPVDSAAQIEVDTTSIPVVPVVTAKPKEQRQTNRRDGNPIQVYLAEPQHKATPEKACLLDRSTGGMRVAVFHEVAAGTVLSIRPIRADDMIPWIDLEVRSCRPSGDADGEFILGCQFVKTPPYSILLLFG